MPDIEVSFQPTLRDILLGAREVEGQTWKTSSRIVAALMGICAAWLIYWKSLGWASLFIVLAVILDLACGFGRHANRLAALGHSMTGVDYMPGFLALARQKAADMGVQVDYCQGDMRQVSFLEEFDTALLLFTSFGYLEDSEIECRRMEVVEWTRA